MAVPPLRITEVNYNPVGGSTLDPNSYEFIELMNTGTTPLSLNGFSFTGGVLGTLNNVTLQPGERGVVVKDQAAFTARYGAGVRIVGTYTDSLDDTGEVIRLEGPGGVFVHDFAYSDTWQPGTDGRGGTLVILDPNAQPSTWGSAASWTTSASTLGTPGLGESALAAGGLFVNEVLSSAAAAGGDFVELRNVTAGAVDISGWWLSDSAGDLTKFRVPAGTVVPAFGYLALTGASTELPFDLSAGGGEVYLSSADANGVLTSFRSGQRFGASAPGVSFGPHLRTTGDPVFTALESTTPGAANATARVGPVVIGEVMYNPAAGGDEFIELRNVGGAAVSLAGWRFTNGVTNDDATQFSFGDGTSLAAGGYALVVGIDPAVFRGKYGVPSYVRIYQVNQADGKFLSNGGETIELSSPGEGGSFVVMDRVEFTDAAPWPTAPDGGGSSLARTSTSAYGDDVGNWAAESNGGSPGYVNFDAAAPTGGIVDVTPDPRVGGVNSILLTFSEPVVLSLGDLTLSRDGGGDVLGSGATLTTENGITWTLAGLAPLTFLKGSYELTMSANVADVSGKPVAGGGDSDAFVVSVTGVGGTDGDDQFYMRVNGGDLEVFLADGPVGQPAYVVPLASIDSFAVDGGDGNDSLRIGTALPFNPLFKGGGGVDDLHVDAGTVEFAADASVDSGQLRLFVNNDATVRFGSKQRLARLSLGGAARVEVAAGGSNPVFAQQLLLSGGIIDLADNDLIVGQGMTAAAMRGLINGGQVRGVSQRNGFPMTFAPIDNSLIRQKTWAGITISDGVTFGQVIVKHTYAGDADLDGVVSEADYQPVTANMGRTDGQWILGDVTNDGLVNSGDFAVVTANLGAGTAGAAGPLLVTLPTTPPTPATNTPPTTAPTTTTSPTSTPTTTTSTGMPTPAVLSKPTKVKPLPKVEVVTKPKAKAAKGVAKKSGR